MPYMSHRPAIRRIAILIESSNVVGQDDLPGARRDMEVWRDFLTSPLGGEWSEDSEIIVKHKPASFEITNLIKEHADDYVFVAFSGHGCERVNADGTSETLLCLNDREQRVPVNSLMPSKFGTIILDCCRGSVEPTTYSTGLFNESRCVCNTRRSNFAERLKRAFSLCQAETVDCNSQARTAFLSRLSELTNQGVLRMLACSYGEGAEDDSRAGGLYTTLLIAGARDWRNKIKSSCQTSMIFTTRDAHLFVCTAIRAKKVSQKPEYIPEDVVYPFAIR